MSFIRHGLFCAKSENKKRCNLSQMIRVHSQIRIKLGVVKIIMMSLLNAMLYDHDHRDHACNQDDRHQTLGKKWENKRVWQRLGFHLGPRLGHLVLLWTLISYSYRQYQWRQWGQRLGFKALPPFHFWRFAWTRSQLTAQSGTSRRHCMPMKMHSGEKSHFGIGQPVLQRFFCTWGLAWTKSQLDAFLRRLPHHNHHMQSADPSLHAAAVPPKLVNWFSLFWQALTQKYKQTDNKTTKGSGAFLYSISKQELPTKYYKKCGVAVALW